MKTLKMIIIIAILAAIFSSCKHQTAEEKEKQSQDSIANAIKERERYNNVKTISKETLEKLTNIYNQLMNAEPGDHIGKYKINFVGEKVYIEDILGKLGSEEPNHYSKFTFSASPRTGTVKITCLANVTIDSSMRTWGFKNNPDYFPSDTTSIFMTKEYDTSKVITLEHWEPFNWDKKINQVSSPGYKIKYNRKTGIFTEMLMPFNDEIFIENTVGAFKRKTTMCPIKLEYEEFSIGGSPENFFKKAIEAFINAKQKKKVY